MNREQKRAQFKAARGNPDALWCDKCGHKTFHAGYKVKGDVDHYDIYCAVCTGFKTRLRLTDNQIDTDGRLHGSRLDERQKAITERKVGKILGKSI